MLILKVALFFLAVEQLTAKLLVCYLTNWSQYRPNEGKFMPDNIDPSLCTHLIYAFAKISKGVLATYEWNDETLYQKTMDLKKSNANLKVLLAVGGWNMGSTDFSNMVTNDASRANFVRTSVEFLRKYGFDGLDLDWEYPANGGGSRPSDRAQFTKLVQELKQAFESSLLLTAALAAGRPTIESAYEIAQISKYLDFANIMTYDYHGSWEQVTGANAPLYARTNDNPIDFNVDATINIYLSGGMPANKIILGMGAYGRAWTLANPSNNDVGSPATGAGQAGTFTREASILSYYEICEKLAQGWTRKWNDEQKIPYAFSGNQWVSYDDEQSLQLKVDYLKSKNLGGAMFWSLDLDDFTGSKCSKGKYPLVAFVKKILGGSGPGPTTIRTSRGPITTTKKGAKTTTTRRRATLTTRRSATTTTKEGSGGKCANGDGFYPDIPSGCTKFYRCVSGVAHDFSCPDNTKFDAALSVCNWADQVKCG